MKFYKMNKNVEHNGKLYAKGQEIKPSDAGFKEIVDKGHAEVIEVSEKSEEPMQESSEVASGPEEQSSESVKPARKSKK